MNAKHTPGPWMAVNSSSNGWEIRGLLGSDPVRRNMVEFTYASDKPVLLFVEPWHQFPNAEWSAMQGANANLIAAAPDLLKALEDCVAVMDRELAGLKAIQPELSSARAAIAKATGEPQ